MKTIISLLAIVLLLLSASCETDTPTMSDDSPLVVEGWIEDAAAPVVLVTHAVDLNAGVDNFDDCVEKWARVSVSDGDREVILHAKIDKSYFPSIIYTTSDIKGVKGKEYRLTVETETDTVWATTRIPEVTRLKKFITSRAEGSDSLISLRALVNVDPDVEGYYKFFTRVNSDETRYYSSFLGTYRASSYNSHEGWEVHRGIHATNGDKRFTPFYHSGDTVYVKFCTMEKEGYDYWQDYESIVSLGSNMFFPVIRDCRTNIRGNGRGYWIGYGVSFGKIIIPNLDTV